MLYDKATCWLLHGPHQNAMLPQVRAYGFPTPFSWGFKWSGERVEDS